MRLKLHAIKFHYNDEIFPFQEKKKNYLSIEHFTRNCFHTYKIIMIKRLSAKKKITFYTQNRQEEAPKQLFNFETNMCTYISYLNRFFFIFHFHSAFLLYFLALPHCSASSSRRWVHHPKTTHNRVLRLRVTQTHNYTCMYVLQSKEYSLYHFAPYIHFFLLCGT